MTAPRKAVAVVEMPDFSSFPPGSVTPSTRRICVSCVFQVFTRQLNLAPRTAYAEIRKHQLTVEELTAASPPRPYFEAEDPKARCPYCDAVSKWHANLGIWRIEGSKATDTPRRALAKNLDLEEEFQILEVKSNTQDVFYKWLETLTQRMELDGPSWLMETAQAFLERREPRTDWAEIFAKVQYCRRSRRIEEGFEVEQNRLYLAPELYDQVLLVQYLVSRSHHSGGFTFEGRLVLSDLLRRLRRDHYLQQHGVSGKDPDVLERLLDDLTGGFETSQKVYYLVDRRQFLACAKGIYAKAK